MNKKIIQKRLFRSWLTLSNFFYNIVEACPARIFSVLAVLPIFIFWALLIHKQQPSQLAALFSHDPIITLLSGWYDFANNTTAFNPGFLLIGLHTLNVGIFLYLVRPYLSKLMALWACWYVGIHPSHLSWLGRIEYLPYIVECTMILSTISAVRTVFQHTTNPFYRLCFISMISCCWAPINIWLGLACTTLASTYFWPLDTKQCTILFFSYAMAQFCAIFASPLIGSTVILTNLRRGLVSLFGLNWIPGSTPWLRYGFLLFWTISLIGLFLHTTKRRLAGLLILSVATSLIPQIFIKIHPAFVYTALPAFIGALGILYENTGESDVRSVIKSLIIPVYASFLFNVDAILIRLL